MNKYQQEVFNEVKNDLEVKTDNKCFNEKIEYLIKAIKDLDLISKYDLLYQDFALLNFELYHQLFLHCVQQFLQLFQNFQRLKFLFSLKFLLHFEKKENA